VFKVRTDIMPL